MSEIVDSLKDLVDPSRRESATAPSYDPNTRGPYPDRKPASEHEQLAPPVTKESEDPARAEQTDLSLDKSAETSK